MDIVLNSFIDNFIESYELQDGKQNLSMIFELFSEYVVASDYKVSETLTKSLLYDLNTGNGNDWGIDSFIPIVNGQVVTDADQVDEFKKANRYLEVEFILVQSKTSSHIEASEFRKLLDGCNYLFRGMDTPEIRPKCNTDIDRVCNIVKTIYQYSADFKNGKNPSLNIYYVYQGDYQIVEEVESSIALSKNEMERLSLFSDVTYHILDKQKIINMYKKSVNVLNAELAVGNERILLPEVEGVSEGYICLIPFKEFKKLIMDENGAIIKAAFEDNVRDYQGSNLVNRSMASSLHDGDISLFTMMNNGITVIAKSVRFIRQKVHLEDYQIVNGCQTSHVLQQNAGLEGIEDLRLIVKIIGSEDKTIRDKIIVGNNSQTEVKREQLISLLNSQRIIEDYYLARNDCKLYYERRSKQYRGDASVPQARIITISRQIQSFIAMILGEPHKVRGYYGQIIEDFNHQEKAVIDTNVHHASLYFIAGLAWYKEVQLFENGKIDKKLKQLKNHLLYTFRLLVQPSELPKSLSKEEEYSNKICEILKDETRCESAFKEAADLINEILANKPSYYNAASENLTFEIKVRVERLRHSSHQSLRSNDIPLTIKEKQTIQRIGGDLNLKSLKDNRRPTKHKKSR